AVTSPGAGVTLAIRTSAGGGTLTCTTNPVTAVSAVGTFHACNDSNSSTDYCATAPSAGLTTATSGTFNITVGAASQLAFTTQPRSEERRVGKETTSGWTAQDSGGNTVTSSSAGVTLASAANPGGGTLH